MRKKKEIREKILETNRVRKIAFAGLIIGVSLTFLGLTLFTPLFVVGFTMLVICTGAASFLTAVKWGYSKALKMEVEKKVVTHTKVCPRCTTQIREGLRYCPNCGKKIQAKKH
ncbi:MAG: zinc ribbon domain-containing protein [Candidatus Bathyarchaeota archaeon]|nr:MAG: zinc ribbon domain-containing protein [Candidatus Bathyarchaeota archaeon]